MRNYVFLFLLLIISCKKSEPKIKIISKDENLDLKYEFLNQQLTDDLEFYSRTSEFLKEPIKGRVYTLISGEFIEDAIRDEDSLLSKEDKEYIKHQFADSVDFPILKNKLKVKGVYFLSKEEKKELQAKNNPESFWNYFRKKYPGKCIRNISIPVFNKAKDLIIVSLGDSCGGLEGEGGMYILKKIKGKWKIVKTLNTWVS